MAGKRPAGGLGINPLDETRTTTAVGSAVAGEVPAPEAPLRPAETRAGVADERPAAAPPPTEEAGRSIDFRLVQCLVVDPSPYQRRLVKDALDVFDMRLVTEVSTGRAALATLRQAWFDVVMLDFHLPDLTGAEVTRQIRRATAVWSEVPVVMLTADTEPSRVLESRDAGIHEFLARPFSAADLFLRVAYSLQHPRPFVRTADYIGPDRRWLDRGPDIGQRERRMVREAAAKGRDPYRKA